MTFRGFLYELSYPARNLGTIVAIVTFWLLLKLAFMAGLLGIWLLVMILPAFFRYVVLIAQARARGSDAAPPGIDYFSLAGNLWTLFPALPAYLVASAWGWIGEAYGDVAAAIFAMIVAVIVPAMMSVLVITQSPTQSLNPQALYRLITHTGNSYWYAPIALVSVFAVSAVLAPLPAWISQIADLYMIVAFYAVTGAITREQNLIEQVDIEEPVEKSVQEQIADLEKARTTALNHAYGFVSRGNRAGGLSHIHAWIMRDPDPVAAWPWFFGQMLKWEETDHALYFAQDYLHWLLARNETVPAVKVIMRCRMLNNRFRPRPEDRAAAIAAAQSCGNDELASDLKRL